MNWSLIITFFILIILEMKDECIKIYLLAFSDHTLLKTGNICARSTSGQNLKVLYKYRNTDKSNIEENSILKLKLIIN